MISKTAAAAGESIRRTDRAGAIELKPIIDNLFVAAAALERVSCALETKRPLLFNDRICCGDPMPARTKFP